ncbi:MAG TPA: SDR family oxidoreductase [Polyangiaceae bacterium]|nr:SDR family oxidoreductase [Polyangiaceae bacterium]
MDLGLKGKRALVTGSSRGTGAAIAKALAREGAIVVVHGNAPGDQERIASELSSDGAAAHAVTGDVTTDEGAARVVQGTVALVGGLDVLVNNYGQATGGTWDEPSSAGFLRAYEVNTLSAVRMIDGFVGGMKERRHGRIVQITTIGTTRPGPRMPEYYAAKGALATLTVSLSKELAGTGVTVNTVSPGLIRTAEMEAYFRHLASKHGWGDDWDEIEAKGVHKLTGVRATRMARPDEVADLVAFLVSERAAYLTGGNYRVDGGATETVQ